DPDEHRLGADALTLTASQLALALGRSTAPVKARLTDQTRFAGLDNLLTDEALLRAGFDPARAAGTLVEGEIEALAAAVAETVAVLDGRGGSHTGDLQAARRRGGSCPRDGALLDRRVVAGRTTYSCPDHQH